MTPNTTSICVVYWRSPRVYQLLFISSKLKVFEVIEEPNSRISIMTCIQLKSPSVALGITSVLVLLVAEDVVNAAGGCVCCCGDPYHSTCKKIIAIICLVVSCYLRNFSHYLNRFHINVLK